MGLFSSSSTPSFLGVDIGTSSIKIVELKKEAGQAKLLTYGFSENKEIISGEGQHNPAYLAGAINRICNEAGMVSRTAVSALPTFSVFSSIINLSSVNKKDIDSAVHWEAKKVIPLPLEEMILDWKIINNGQAGADQNKNQTGKNVKVLLTGAPKSLVKKYIDIFKEAKINLLSLETETFSLVRSLVGNDKSPVMLVELGAATTDISIINNGIPLLSRSIDVGGIKLTKEISNFSKIEIEKAEQFKFDLGVSALDSAESGIPQIVTDVISPIVNEIKYALNLFRDKYKLQTEKIILSGGSALLPNLTGYLGKVFNIQVLIGDPWARISYPVD
ncbi:MAG: type IV pilus assembly protein PilM, partial [Candidatus Falkowbacteria bacterium]|nr:type IV pilus assembly protein PilM [Candidatus Falkowbacteria bacterium]